MEITCRKCLTLCAKFQRGEDLQSESILNQASWKATRVSADQSQQLATKKRVTAGMGGGQCSVVE